MPIYLGSTSVKPYRGSTEIKEVYRGSTLVYQNKHDYIVFDGTNPADYTGGWQISREYSNQNRNYSLSGAYLRSGKTGGYGPNQAYMTVSNTARIDMTDYTTATIDYEVTGHATYGDWAIGVNNSNGQTTGQISGKASVSRRTATINISSYGLAYFNFYAYTTGGGIPCYVTIYNITLS